MCPPAQPVELQLPQPVLQLESSTDFSSINGIVLISLDMFTSTFFNYMHGVSQIYVIVFSGFIVSTSNPGGCLTTILIIILRQPLYLLKLVKTEPGRNYKKLFNSL